MVAYLILEDGSIFEGRAVGAVNEVISEIVFNTSMTGYLEVMTDPSYAGQAVVMTYPLIGNYGVCYDDMESGRPWIDALIVRELSRMPSNFRCEDEVEAFLEKNGITAISGIDTRALTRKLRDKGTMNGMITTRLYAGEDLTAALARIRAYRVQGVVRAVSCRKKTLAPALPEGSKARFRVALLDLGAKRNIVRELQKRGCEVSIYPASTSAEEILAGGYDGLMLSNGPGDPKENVEVIEELKKLYESSLPIFAICLGHQLLALATGADTYKLKYGHRGGNHPVKDMETGRVYISAQNHGYAVATDTLNPAVAVPAFYNVNDGTNEGLRYVNKNIMTVQYHPEACPGPRDSAYLFDRFLQMMEEKINA